MNQHILVNGEPLCRYGQPGVQPNEYIPCQYSSGEIAKQKAKLLQGKWPDCTITVEPGDCPRLGFPIEEPRR